jgi:DNA-binding NtrC family response regulator
MQTLEGVVSEIAGTSIPVLLVGESGTGKEVFARRLHRLSPRSETPMHKILCAAMDATTFCLQLGLQSKGSGETRSKAGTVFFDEIAELNASCQRNLLHALPDGDVSERPGVLRSRIISATSHSLDEEMRAGRFRTDLYYRINGVCLKLPPLRERKEDIPLLLEHFLTKHAAQFGRPRPSLSARTLRAAMEYSWPGNIRELENFTRKIVALGNDEMAISEMEARQTERPVIETAAPRGYSLKAAARAASREAERELILKALERTRWNRKRAAQELQISYKSLLYKLKQIGFEESQSN